MASRIQGVGVVVLLASVCLAVWGEASRAEYYVGTRGRDENRGTIDEPLRTIGRAASLMKAGDTCYIRGGRYHESVVIRGLEGSAGGRVVFTAYRGERVILDGSEAITSRWSRYKGDIFKTRLERPVWQLFVGGRSMCSARWPNGNWEDGSIWDKAKSMSWPERGRSSFGHHYNSGLGELGFGLGDGGIVIVNSGSFKTYKAFVTEHEAGGDNFVYDTRDVKVHFSYEEHVEKHGYFLEGKLGLLDAEGEWFYEPRDSMLYLWAPGGVDPNALDIRGKRQSYAFDVAKSSYIELRGLDFFGTTFKFVGCDHVTIEDCNLVYPSYSKRMLRNMEAIDVTKLVVSGEFEGAYNTVRNCVFEYADGPGIELNGRGNLVENCCFHDVDYSCTYKGGYTLNMVDAAELVFRRNTVHTTGASETFKAGVRNLIELNDISRSGYLQNDGSMIQISVKQQDRSQTRYNWLHESVKQGLRFDNSNKPNSPWGENGRAHHNVAWKTARVFFKGDKHFIYNNLSFDSHKNDLIISSDVKINGRNYSTITRNNIAGTFSGHITRGGKEYPVPGRVDHNWAGDAKKKDVRSQLRDPDNLDFRPRGDSDLVDGGVVMGGFDHDYLGKAPDIGPYEYGDTNYWIPGRKEQRASRPIPPDEGADVKLDADLMWLGGYSGKSHDVYFGTSRREVERGARGSAVFKGNQANNIFDPAPGRLEPGRTYFWRVDVVCESGTIRGRTWCFRTGVRGDSEKLRLTTERTTAK